MTPSVTAYPALQELHAAAADAFCDLVNQAVGERNRCSIVLSGGSTPRVLYEMLAQRDLPWDRIHWFWGDERNVPHNDEQSNYLMVRRALLDHVPIPSENVHPVPINVSDPASAASEYEATIVEQFGGGEFPDWDLVLLGMGDDGHTASLFPHTAALKETDRRFVENWVEKFESFRYTLTAPAINSGRQIWFLVSGAGKREALTSVLSRTETPEEYPSQLILPTRWFVTEDAFGTAD